MALRGPAARLVGGTQSQPSVTGEDNQQGGTLDEVDSRQFLGEVPLECQRQL